MFTTVVNFDPNQRELKLKGRSETDSAKVLGPNITMPAAHFGRTHRRCYNGRSGAELAIVFLLLAPATSRGAELKPETLQAWKAHVCAAKVRMEERTNGRVPFLWVDEDRDLTQRLRVGEILLRPVDGDGPRPVPRGLIHDWIGAVFVAKASAPMTSGDRGHQSRPVSSSQWSMNSSDLGKETLFSVLYSRSRVNRDFRAGE